MLALRDGFWNRFDSMFDIYKAHTFSVFEDVEKFPKFKTLQEESDLVIEVAVPGFDKDEIDISVEDDILTISSTKESTEEGNGRMSSYKTSFVKRYSLSGYEHAPVPKAKLENGVLRVVFEDFYKELPKPEPKQFKIPIE